MRPLLKFSSDAVKTISVLLAGILLFLALAFLSMNSTIMNPDFHRRLFEKNNIYYHCYNFINNTIAVFIDSAKDLRPDNQDSGNNFFMLLENPITEEIVSTNLDLLREGLFKYFSGESSFLPDIEFKLPSKSLEEVNNSSRTLSSVFSDTSHVNLEAILMYLNRSDINTWIKVTKALYYISATLPALLIIIFLMLAAFVLYIYNHHGKYVKWFALSLASGGILSLFTSAAVYTFTRFLIPAHVSYLSVYAPAQSSILLSYISDCTNAFIIYQAFSGILLLTASLIISGLAKKKAACISLSFLKTYFSFGPNTLLTAKRITCIAVIAASALAVSYRAFGIDSRGSENLISAILKIRSANSQVNVIPAVGYTIYNLEIRLIDEKTGLPLKDIELNIEGKSAFSEKQYNQYSFTDENGTARFFLDNGSYTVSFIVSPYTKKYIFPPSFQVDLKTAGTTIINMNIGCKD